MTIVTKDGRIISSDQNLQSANSNELMMQEWYQQAIDLSHNQYYYQVACKMINMLSISQRNFYQRQMKV